MTESPDPARKIPAPIRREVRQRCGFGCVVCGLPLYEYEHMMEWAEIRRHEADEITLLCDQHHREKTSGLLPIEEVARANAAPFNMREGASSPYTLHFSGPQVSVDIGSNAMTASTSSDFAALMIDGVPIVGFRFEDGHYLLNVALFDVLNECVLQIVDNELVYSADPWDVEFVGRRLIIRAAARQIFIDMTFEAPSAFRLNRGRILFNGIEVFIAPTHALIVNNTCLLQRNVVGGFPVGLNIGADPRQLPSAFRISGVPRYEIDRGAALDWAREQLGSDPTPDGGAS